MKKKDIDLGTISLDKFIAHDIPRRLKSDEVSDIPLSESLPKLDNRIMSFFSNRLQGTLASKGQLVDIDPRIQDPFLPKAMNDWFDKPNLIPFSQSAARHLYMVQGGSASAGMLGVAAAKIDGKRAIALMKLPEEVGVRFEKISVGGKDTYSVTLLGDLTLTENTKVFKAALLWRDDGAITGLVSDDQTQESSAIADYFLSEFLGCRHMVRPRTLTKAFKDTVTEFINKQVTDEDDKIRYFIALQAELHSNKSKIDPPDFIQKHVRKEHKGALQKKLREKGVPTAAFSKDLTGLPSQGRKSRYMTQGGITISGDAGEMEERVEVRESNSGSEIVIHDQLRIVR